MSVKSEKAEELRREKARNLRYKKAIHAELNLETITSELYEMWEKASDVLYWCEDDGSTQLDELIVMRRKPSSCVWPSPRWRATVSRCWKIWTMNGFLNSSMISSGQSAPEGA